MHLNTFVTIMTPHLNPISLQMLAENICQDLNKLPTDKEALCFYGNPLQSNDPVEWIQRWPNEQSPNSWDWLAAPNNPSHTDQLRHFLANSPAAPWLGLKEKWTLWEWLWSGLYKDDSRVKVEADGTSGFIATQLMTRAGDNLINAFFKFTEKKANACGLSMHAMPIKHFPCLDFGNEQTLHFESNGDHDRLDLIGIKQQFKAWRTEYGSDSAAWVGVSPFAAWIAAKFFREQKNDGSLWVKFDPATNRTLRIPLRYWDTGGKNQVLTNQPTRTSRFIQACAMENWLQETLSQSPCMESQ
jgi:hypothetical protein